MMTRRSPELPILARKRRRAESVERGTRRQLKRPRRVGLRIPPCAIQTMMSSPLTASLSVAYIAKGREEGARRRRS